MDKDILNDSIEDNFLLVINSIVDEKSKKLNKKKYVEGFNLLGAEIFPQNKIPFSENERSIGATAYNSSRITYYLHSVMKTTEPAAPWKERS